MSPEEIQLSHVTCSSAVMWTWTLWMINLGKACVTFKHISQLKSVASRPVWIGAERLVDWRHALVRRSKRSGLKERWGLSRLKVSEGLWTVVSARWRTAGARRGGAAVWKPHDSNENNPDYKSCFPLGFFSTPLWNRSREEIKCVSLFRSSADLIFSASTLPAFILLLSADCQSDGESLLQTRASSSAC